MSNAKVELIDVAFKGSGNAGLRTPINDSATVVVATRCEFASSRCGAVIRGSLTSATFNDCVFHDNEDEGIWGSDGSRIHLHGEATAIHSNGRWGICAWDSCKVLLHLPSNHNTTYNNGREDRCTHNGGTITNVPT